MPRSTECRPRYAWGRRCSFIAAVGVAMSVCAYAAAQNSEGVAVSFYDPAVPNTGPLYAPANNLTAGINQGAGILNWDISQEYWNDLPGTGSQGSGSLPNLLNAAGNNSGINVSWAGTDVGSIDWPGITPDGLMMNGTLLHVFGNEITVSFDNLPSHWLASGYHVFVYVDWEWFGLGAQGVSFWSGGSLIEGAQIADQQAASPGGFQNPQHYIDAASTGIGNYLVFYNKNQPSFEIRADAGGMGVTVINGIQIVPHVTSAPTCTVCGNDYHNAVDENEPCGVHINDFCERSGCGGHCGGTAPTGCWCDSQCCAFNDCCADQNLLCNECTGGPTPIACGDTVCGTLWSNRDGTLDIDRYAFEVADANGTGMANIEVTIDTETELTLWIDNGECPWEAGYLEYAQADVSTCAPATIVATVPAPGAYYLRIEPSAGMPPPLCPDTAPYVFELTCTGPGPAGPANELCASALQVGYVSQLPFDNLNAVTDGPLEPGCGFTGVDDSDVWFEFIAPAGGGTLVTVEPDPAWPLRDRHLAVYQGNCPAAGQVPLDCSVIGATPSTAKFNAVAGDSYLIRVGTIGGQAGEGHFLLSIEPQVVCVGDLNGDGFVNVADLLILLSAWGNCPNPFNCPADLNGDGVVNVADMLILLSAWGPCP